MLQAVVYKFIIIFVLVGNKSCQCCYSDYCCYCFSYIIVTAVVVVVMVMVVVMVGYWAWTWHWFWAWSRSSCIYHRSLSRFIDFFVVGPVGACLFEPVVSSLLPCRNFEVPFIIHSVFHSGLCPCCYSLPSSVQA